MIAGAGEGPGPGEPSWLATFPHLVRPLPGEGLLGLTLRADGANGWRAGATAAFVYPHATGPATLGRRAALLAVGTGLDLGRLAACLELPAAAIEATVYGPRLRRLYGVPLPGPRLLGPPAPFGVCPACIAEDGLIPLAQALPGAVACPSHRLALAARCACGVPLAPFAPRARPHHCRACGRWWGTLLAVRAGEGELRLQRETGARCLELLGNGTPAEVAALSRPAPAGGRGRSPWGRSLAALASARPPVAGADPDRASRHGLRCLNRTCPGSCDVAGTSVRLAGRRDGGREWYCATCGARFLGGRIYQAFDHGCAAPGEGPSPAAIGRARARLDRWRSSLEATCAAMRAAGEPISIDAAFARAGVPRRANLRAARLGLVALVAGHAQAQRATLPPRERLALHRRQPGSPAHLGARAAVAVPAGLVPAATDLGDAEWAAIAALFDPRPRGGRRHEPRAVVDAIRLVLATGGPWSALPPGRPPWKLAHQCYRRWQRAGLWARLEDRIEDRLRRAGTPHG